jgi:outer membrane receptor protein involved in Fe transport
MSRLSTISRAVRSALSAPYALKATVACGLCVVGTSAWGQAPAGADTGDTITVTGSRLRRDAFNSVSPVQLITREEVTAAGFSSATEALQSTAVTTGGAQLNNAFGGFVTDGGPGTNTLSLRGLGPERTLILINGRRIAPSGTRGAVGSSDLNVLPNAIVDHIEILKDGASSVYGSDAIAGVVNLVTKSDIEGVTFEAQYKSPLDGGGERSRVSVSGGWGGDRWSFAGSLEFFDRADLTLADRDWTRCNTDMLLPDPATGAPRDFIDPLTGQPKCYPITGTGSNGVTINTIGTNTITAANFAANGLNGPGVPAAGATVPAFNRWRPNPAVTTGVIGFEGVGGALGAASNNLNVRDTFEPRMLNESLISPTENTNVFMQAAYDMESLGNAELYFDFLGSRRESEQTNYRQFALDYRVGSPLIPANLAFSVFAPDQGISGGANVGVRVFQGFGNYTDHQVIDFYKPGAGLRGDIGSEWRYDANVSFSMSDGQYMNDNFLIDKLIYAGDVVAAPAGTDPTLVRNGLTCRINVTNPAERCIPYPPLDTAVIGGVMPADFLNYAYRSLVGNTDYDEEVYTVAFDGPVASLPAGRVMAAFGYEYRHAEIDDTPDPNSIANNIYNFTSGGPTRGEDNVNEVFTEIEVPLLTGRPGARELTVNGSLRYTDYDSYGSDNTYKLGIMYRPIDWFSVRVTQGTSFRAPALYEQFQGATSGFLSQTADPCYQYGSQNNPVRAANCASEGLSPDFIQTGSVRVFSEGGAAAGLEAETSDNLTYGIIIQPELGDASDLSVAIDYFDIEINNGVAQAGGTNILNKCYDDPDFRAGGGFCNLVTRNAAQSQQLTVSNAHTNIATQLAEGIDYTVRYDRELGPGSFRMNAQATHYLEQSNKLFEEDALDELNGSLNNPENIANLTLSYYLRNWRFVVGVDWIDDMESYTFLTNEATPQSLPATLAFLAVRDFYVGDYQEHYMSVRYASERWEITGGVRNLFDEEPPTISSGTYNRQGNSPYYSGYDFFGREAFVNVSYSLGGNSPRALD